MFTPTDKKHITLTHRNKYTEKIAKTLKKPQIQRGIYYKKHITKTSNKKKPHLYIT